MSPQQLECFIALAETGHFAKASSMCFVSPSAFTRIIQRTEEEVGAALCIRGGREIQLTEAGKKFLIYSRESLRNWRHIRQEMKKSDGQLSGELRIFSTVTACYSILPSILEDFRKRHPTVSIHLQTGDAAEALDLVRREEVDCAIAPIPETGVSDLEIQPLTTTSLVFVAPANRLQKFPQAQDGASIAQLLDSFPDSVDWSRLPLILPERMLARERIDLWFASRNIQAKLYAQVACSEGILAMVHLGLGIGLVPQLVVKNSPLAERLRILPHIQEVPDFLVGIATKRSARILPNTTAFMNSASKNDGLE